MDKVQEQTGTPAMNAEQAADLAALTAAAGEGGGQVAPAADQAQEAPKPALHEEIAAALTMAVSVLGKALPSVAAIYTPEVTQAVGVSVAAVCNKHGWMQGGLMGKWGEEIACLLVVGPLAWSTYEAGKADIAALKSKAKKDAPALGTAKVEAVAAQTAPGAATVTFGTVGAAA